MRKLLSFVQPRTLQQRNGLYILLPTLIILVVMAITSLLLVREVLLDQWRETAIAKLHRAVLQVDSRLLRPKRLLMLYQQQSGEEFNRQVSEFLLDRLRNLEGVVDVNLEWFGKEQTGGRSSSSGSVKRPMMRAAMRYQRMNQLEVTRPVYDADFDSTTVSLVSEFRDEEDQILGHITVKISFYDLIDKIVKSPWWKSNKAFLVDGQGNILTRTTLFEHEDTSGPKTFGPGSKLEKRTLRALQRENSGTLLGPGLPPEEISGFFRLREAPWTIVLIAPGELALQPILQFRMYYFITISVGILLSLLLIRTMTTGTTRSIREVSEAAQKLANGTFGAQLQVKSCDEVGELTENFNIMSSQLKERLQLQEAMNLAREVQQNFLPQSCYSNQGIDICGASFYCQETGGDYFDILPDENETARVSVLVGDVVGHGVGAALLMSTIRALVRCRTMLPGSPSDVMNDVNSLLCRDTEVSGSFITLFYLIIDSARNTVQWVRCGHDPAIAYNIETGEFSELKGEGLVLGFDGQHNYTENQLELSDNGQVILIGSDGVWETENSEGERFGRKRLKKLIAAHAHHSSEEIIGYIHSEVSKFRGELEQADDITLMVVKV